MILDTQSLFADAQAVTATGGISTNVYDKNAAKVFFGRGRPMQILVVVTTAFGSGGATTMQIELVTDDNAGMATPTKVAAGDVVAKIGFWDQAGYIYTMPMPPYNDLERYFALRYTIATGPFTSGNLTAGVTLPGFQTRLTGAWL